MSSNDARERFRNRVKKSLKKADGEFKGQYKDQISGLLGLSQAEIGEITPDGTDIAVYNQLITVVKEASRANVEAAELKATIQELGEVAVTIAKKVPSLAALV